MCLNWKLYSAKETHWCVYLFLCFLCGRVLLLCSLYFFDTPYGGNVVNDWTSVFPYAFALDIGIFALFSAILALFKSPKFSGIFLLLYMLCIGMDDECKRWMDSRLYLKFLRIFLDNNTTDFSLVSKIFMDGFWHFILTISIALGTFIFYAHLKKSNKHLLQGIGILAVIAAMGLSNILWFYKNSHIWLHTQPIALVYLDETLYEVINNEKPDNYEAGIIALGGNPQEKYPFWQAYNDDSAYTAFKKIPLEEKPDIFILVIESLRGWKTNIKNTATCANIPNLCNFSSEAMFFPEAHSGGFPSLEGLVGIQMGIWSHPTKTTIRMRKEMYTLSLPDILGQAGYYNVVFTPVDIIFRDMMSFFQNSFDHIEGSPKSNDDILLANKFNDYLSKANRDKPLYITWISVTTHIPFETPDGKKSYDNALHYADSAIGLVLNSVKKYRRNKLILIVTGDHSYPEGLGGEEFQEFSRIYENHNLSKFTHIPLWIQSPSSQNGYINEKIISQLDIAPTILNELGLLVSNYFPGHNIFSNSAFPVFAFINKQADVYNYEKFPQAAEDAMKAWAWILDNNKLMPPRIIYRPHTQITN